MLDRSPDLNTRLTTFGDFEILSEGPAFDKYTRENILYTYWQDHGGPEQTITRADINPAKLTSVLKHMVIMDITAGCSPYAPAIPTADSQHDFTATVKLIGTFVVDFYGEITDKDIYQMEHTSAANRIYHMTALALDTKTPQLSVASGYTDQKEHLKSYALYLPLFDGKKSAGPEALPNNPITKMLVYVDVVTLNDQSI
ncbi:hypothetical protein [Kordiimonas sp. SCSIO 12610]|uniref:hypothetical protein n=1 Tax=Kordiimonas sp. SCSIO 12610 TaxID=2829597 RepID=UPI0021086AA5|nr:hypothetical protein [Kordiimonas sp. SCSIO 12610]UTW56131.1 hypothetical protein KFF44_04340 [Kordiimonas sp. SCSIO 12610]